MRTLSKITLAAAFGLAMTFTLSCSGDDGGIDGQSSSTAESPSSSGIAPSSSSGKPSSSSVVPSSSGTVPSSSSLPSSSSQTIVPVYGEPITDARDGKTYETVVIGTQTWMAKNLDFEVEGSKCYNDNALNCTLYGSRLYNFETAKTACPAGWHLPSDMEWIALEDFIGGTREAAWKKLRTTSGWSSVYGNGTDDYGFSALPDGNRGIWWSSTERGTSAYYRRASDGATYNDEVSRSSLYSVRCVKGDDSPSLALSSSSYTPVSCAGKGDFCDDRDGTAYKSVDIDGKTWMAENLNYAVEGSKCYGEGGLVLVIGGVITLVTLSDAEVQANCKTYGRLYDWSTAMALDPACNKRDYCKSEIAEKHKGVCPSGWHIPSDAEWTSLVNFAGGSTAGQILKAESGWNDYNGTSGNGADLLGFSALPGGYGNSDGGFGNVGNSGNWWSSTEINAADAWYRLINGNANVSRNSASVIGYDYVKARLFSVRCVQD